MKRRYVVLCACLILVGLGFLTRQNILDSQVLAYRAPVAEQQGADEIRTVEPLPVVGDQTMMLKLLHEMEERAGQYSYVVYGSRLMRINDERAINAQASGDFSAAAEKSVGMAEEQTRYSETNVQIAGIDEGDSVKTDGEYLYQIIDPSWQALQPEYQVVIAKVYPAETMSIVSCLRYPPEEFAPCQLFVDEHYLTVIGEGPVTQTILPAEANAADVRNQWDMPGNDDSGIRTKVLIYDITDRTNPRQIREVQLDGNYLAARKIGSALYLAANRGMYHFGTPEERTQPELPCYADSQIKEGDIQIGYQDIAYFPEALEPNYLLIAALDLDAPQREVQVSAYLGAGEQVMASADHLYVAVRRYQHEEAQQIGVSTRIYRFALAQGTTYFAGMGEVPGGMLNQFSMDAYAGALRVATTTEWFGAGAGQSRNQLYILDDTMQIQGRIEDLAPGEKIYSVRLMGTRGFMVTYRTVDPLFVIDLRDPSAPFVLGTLKIPGYSDYLQLYDENHLLGIGKDTVEITSYDPWSGEPRQDAYYQGMKLSLFDVRDVSAPVELFKETIGDRGTDSEVLYQHKALLLDREKQLLAFPLTVCEVQGAKINSYGVPEYGQSVFQGAYVYRLDLNEGFQLRQKIAHPSVSGDASFIRRLLYIGDTLYSVSQQWILAHDLISMAEKGSLKLLW
ncbi:MAG: beta-propeller domain-containing protein [Peptococcaceae bacterium]|jgi:uncharacterized secreted protein with C-terminal beta-propeller domain|nr:beta-propeller domain-containing protein [Peptococcaceae bacterium]